MSYYAAVGLSLSILLFCSQALSKDAPQLNTSDIEFYNDKTKQPVKVKFWYQIGEKNCEAKICLAKSQANHKVAIISHGAFGSPIEMNWLGYALASQGWLVAGVAHYGESWVYGKETIDPSTVMRFWQRPQEISFVIDRLSDSGLFNLSIQTHNTLMLGHSSGGFTALAMAGSKLEVGKSQAYCHSDASKGDKSCAYNVKQNTVPLSTEKLEKLNSLQAQMYDARIKAVIALDPALGHAVNETSLKNINIPTLIFGSVENDFLPFNRHAKYYAEQIEHAELIGIEQGAGHFIYINECKHKFLAKGVSLCKDRDGVDRKVLQKQILNQVFGFIYKKGLNNV